MDLGTLLSRIYPEGITMGMHKDTNFKKSFLGMFSIVKKKNKSEKNTVIPPSIGSRGNEMVPVILNSLEFESVCKKWLQRP